MGQYFQVEAGDFFIDIEKSDEEKLMAAKRLGKYAEMFAKKNKELDMNILKDMPDEQVKELIAAGFYFKHKTYEERLAECGGVAQPYKFEWGESKGREMFHV